MRKTLRASFPKLKNEKKYYGLVSIVMAALAYNSKAYLVNSISFVIIDYSYLDSICEIEDRVFFDINYVLRRHGDLHAISIVV